MGYHAQHLLAMLAGMKPSRKSRISGSQPAKARVTVMSVLQQRYLVLTFLVLLGCDAGARPTLAQQDVGPNDWPQFRGPNGNGVSTEKGWSVTWPESGPKQLWKINVGTGASSVTVCNRHRYTMGNVEDQDIIYCLDPATDKEIWRYAPIPANTLNAPTKAARPPHPPPMANASMPWVSWACSTAWMPSQASWSGRRTSRRTAASREGGLTPLHRSSTEA